MQVYLDYNSTTPLDERVLSAMLPFFGPRFGNPSSAHTMGSVAAQAVSIAREQVAELVGAEQSQVVFCASATEANNWVLRSASAGKIVSTVVEHPSCLRPLERVQSNGGQVQFLPVDGAGRIDLDQLSRALTDGTSLVSVMWVNNETGVISPIEEIAALCIKRGIPLHVDASQAAGKLPIDVLATPIDYITLSSHKVFGPKGAGALIHAAHLKPPALLLGGGQENGASGGTENVPAVVGFGLAARIAKQELVTRAERASHCRNLLEHLVLSEIDRCWVNGKDAPRVGNTSNIGFDAASSEAIVDHMNAAGYCISSGSACHSSTTEPSYVIQAMTQSRSKAAGSVRISCSHLSTEAEIRGAVGALRQAISSIRSNE